MLAGYSALYHLRSSDAHQCSSSHLPQSHSGQALPLLAGLWNQSYRQSARARPLAHAQPDQLSWHYLVQAYRQYEAQYRASAHAHVLQTGYHELTALARNLPEYLPVRQRQVASLAALVTRRYVHRQITEKILQDDLTPKRRHGHQPVSGVLQTTPDGR